MQARLIGRVPPAVALLLTGTRNFATSMPMCAAKKNKSKQQQQKSSSPKGSKSRVRSSSRTLKNNKKINNKVAAVTSFRTLKQAPSMRNKPKNEAAMQRRNRLLSKLEGTSLMLIELDEIEKERGDVEAALDRLQRVVDQDRQPLMADFDAGTEEGVEEKSTVEAPQDMHHMAISGDDKILEQLDAAFRGMEVSDVIEQPQTDEGVVPMATDTTTPSTIVPMATDTTTPSTIVPVAATNQEENPQQNTPTAQSSSVEQVTESPIASSDAADLVTNEQEKEEYNHTAATSGVEATAAENSSAVDMTLGEQQQGEEDGTAIATISSSGPDEESMTTIRQQRIVEILKEYESEQATAEETTTDAAITAVASSSTPSVGNNTSVAASTTVLKSKPSKQLPIPPSPVVASYRRSGYMSSGSFAPLPAGMTSGNGNNTGKFFYGRQPDVFSTLGPISSSS